MVNAPRSVRRSCLAALAALLVSTQAACVDREVVVLVRDPAAVTLSAGDRGAERQILADGVPRQAVLATGELSTGSASSTAY